MALEKIDFKNMDLKEKELHIKEYNGCYVKVKYLLREEYHIIEGMLLYEKVHKGSNPSGFVRDLESGDILHCFPYSGVKELYIDSTRDVKTEIKSSFEKTIKEKDIEEAANISSTG